MVMELKLSWELITLICALLVHAFATVKWGAHVTASIDSVKDSLIRIDKELEKRDAQITAIWKRIDEIKDLIYKHE